MKNKLLFFAVIIITTFCQAENGYDLWLRYQPVTIRSEQKNVEKWLKNVIFYHNSETTTAIKNELDRAVKGFIAKPVNYQSKIETSCLVFFNSTLDSPNGIKSAQLENEEAFAINIQTINGLKCVVVQSKTDIGLLYGTFNLLRSIQTEVDISEINLVNEPKINQRLLNHWDNLDRTVERGYAGFSLWDWFRLPGYIDPRYVDYARANASIGINGTVLNNVNANPKFLTTDFLHKVAALADVFRPYGIKVYLSIKFSSPISVGGLRTADPLKSKVQEWWQDKADEIYSIIPDFGGFLIKANSEGQPGPQDYGRTHADGANMLAKALKPHGGIVMWRAFVYSHVVPEDRVNQAYNEFVPLDGEFDDNVLIQIKNGPLDFQPREPFSPLFGALQKTNLQMEFQITQEYTGHNIHLTYLAPMYKEVLDADTYSKGKGSTVAKSIDGEINQQKLTAISGVANTGTDINWTGHFFGQANWYAFGRLAWNHELNSEEIANEWLRMTFTNDESFIKKATSMMIDSREAAVNYRTPLGLAHQMGRGHHYGPGPWVKGGRPDWTSPYYSKVDSKGIGFDRTESGSNNVAQYHEPLTSLFNDIKTCPQEYLLWFHHVPWDYKFDNNLNLWEMLCEKYDTGLKTIDTMQQTWKECEPYIDAERHHAVSMLLDLQKEHAIYWRDSMLLYFQTFSKMEIPEKYPKPLHDLDYYQDPNTLYVPY